LPGIRISRDRNVPEGTVTPSGSVAVAKSQAFHGDSVKCGKIYSPGRALSSKKGFTMQGCTASKTDL